MSSFFPPHGRVILFSHQKLYYINHILLAKPFWGFDVFVTYVSSGMFMLYSDNEFETLLTQSPCDGEFFSS